MNIRDEWTMPSGLWDPPDRSQFVDDCLGLVGCRCKGPYCPTTYNEGKDAEMQVDECRHCHRRIVRTDDGHRWIDPEATGDDSIWRETCDEHDTFTAEHEPTLAVS